ncbi:MAG TPA: adenylyltransferase/cytidyltransferase family protein [Candidatus Paceibacterota bacterium]|nr:adenylyltransferase/cytidyltransferase family protein [Candidatus Paceibacterota bacterium]
MSSHVFVSGGFDDIKSRQIRFLEEASKLGSLTVQLWSDQMLEKKTGKPPKFPEAERLYFLRAVRYVTEVKLQPGLIDENVLPGGISHSAVWAVEAAQDNAAKQAFCKSQGLQYKVFSDADCAGFPKSKFVQPEATGRKRVIVTGCYDWFHSGHVRFCEEASQHGDLYVVVGHDANIRLLKGEGRPLFPEAERRYVVGSIRYVKEALISSGHGWLDAEPEMKIIKPDIYAVNEDGDVPEKREYCQKTGLEYLVLKRTPAPGLPKRSSTSLRGY